MTGARPFGIGLVTVCLLLALTACGPRPDADDDAADPATSSNPTATPSPSESDGAATSMGAGADVELTVTGARTLSVSGRAATAFCTYYAPTERTGVNIQFTSADFPGTGTWRLYVQGDDLAAARLLLTIDDAQFSGESRADDEATTGGGRITVSGDVQEASFDLQLTNVADHAQTLHVTGAVRCG